MADQMLNYQSLDCLNIELAKLHSGSPILLALLYMIMNYVVHYFLC